jgi:hypothetical protein
MAPGLVAAGGGSFTVEVKYGKEKLEVSVESRTVTVAWLMETLEEKTGVLRKHQKLICKGKVLEAKRAIAEQAGLKAATEGSASTSARKVTVMLMSSAGGGGAGAQSQQTAGQVALLASRAAKAAALAASHSATDDATDVKQRSGAGAGAAAAAARRSAWVKTGIVGLRGSGIDAIPEEVWALGEGVRVADFYGNHITAVPIAVASLVAVTRIRLAHNRLTIPTVAWEALFTLPHLTLLDLDDNALIGPLPACVGRAAKLEALSLDGNELTELPPEIGGTSAGFIIRVEDLGFRV